MRRWLVLAVVILGLSVASPAWAELLRITPEGQSSFGYQGPTDPVIIGADGFRLTFHGGGNDTLVDPVLLILGIPDATLTTVAPTLTFSGVSDPLNLTVSALLGGTNAFFGTWDPVTGFGGILDAASGNTSAYETIGLDPDGSDSQNYTNWNGATGLTSWGLFVYTLTFDPDFGAGDFVELAGTLAAGTYVIGYGHEAGQSVTPGTTQSTPFTFAGLVQVPEPGTLSLLLPGVALILARRRQQTIT